MTEKMKKICPLCNGEKIIKGSCSCNMEWRGNQKGDDWEDCLCTPDQECSTCSGTGLVED